MHQNVDIKKYGKNTGNHIHDFVDTDWDCMTSLKNHLKFKFYHKIVCICTCINIYIIDFALFINVKRGLYVYEINLEYMYICITVHMCLSYSRSLHSFKAVNHFQHNIFYTSIHAVMDIFFRTTFEENINIIVRIVVTLKHGNIKRENMN